MTSENSIDNNIQLQLQPYRKLKIPHELPRLTGSEDLAFLGGGSELVPQTRLKAHSQCPTLKGLLMMS